MTYEESYLRTSLVDAWTWYIMRNPSVPYTLLDGDAEAWTHGLSPAFRLAVEDSARRRLVEGEG